MAPPALTTYSLIQAGHPAGHCAKVHAMLTDYSPLDVALFTEREAAAKWLKVPVEGLMAQR
jgi:hypothetical protein